MKKSTIAFIAVLSLVFASCDDDWTEALPQVNPQEQAFAVDDITLKSIVPEAVNLQEAYMKDNKVKLFTESVDNLPAGCSSARPPTSPSTAPWYAKWIPTQLS